MRSAISSCRLGLLAVGFAALSGCATVPPASCEAFEQSRRALRYDTAYRHSETETRLAAKGFTPLRRAESLAARWYTVRSNRASVRPCEHLYLNKDLYLLRRPGTASVILVEQRDVYGGDGKLIATKREDVSDQLRATGFYNAAVPFPIPREAPADTYRIVSRLIAKEGNNRERVLGTSSVEFRVQP